MRNGGGGGSAARLVTRLVLERKKDEQGHAACCRQKKTSGVTPCAVDKGGVHRGRVGTKTGLERSFSLYLVCSMARSATRGTRGLADDSNVQIVYLGTNSSTVGRKRARHHQTGEPKSTDTELDCSSMPKIVICIRANSYRNPASSGTNEFARKWRVRFHSTNLWVSGRPGGREIAERADLVRCDKFCKIGGRG